MPRTVTQPSSSASADQANLPDTPMPLDTRRFPTFLTVITLILTFFSAAGNLAVYFRPSYIPRTFNNEAFSMGQEANLPTMFSSLLLLTAAALFWYIGSGKRYAHDSYWRMWMGLSVVFFYLSVDEVAQIHERSANFLRRLFGDHPYLHYTWIAPYAVLVAVTAAVTVPLLRTLPARTRNGMLLAGFIYVMGAMGLEVVEGALDYFGKYESLAMLILVQIEETMEMLGIILMITTLLNYLRDHMPRYSLNISLKR